MNYILQSLEAENWFNRMQEKMIRFVATHPKSHLVHDSIMIHNDDQEDFDKILNKDVAQ